MVSQTPKSSGLMEQSIVLRVQGVTFFIELSLASMAISPDTPAALSVDIPPEKVNPAGVSCAGL